MEIVKYNISEKLVKILTIQYYEINEIILLSIF